MIYCNIRPDIFAKYNVFIYEPIIMKFHSGGVKYIHIEKKKTIKRLVVR